MGGGRFIHSNPGVGLAPGHYVLLHLHQTSLLLRTVLFVVDEARVTLDTFTQVPGKPELERAATAALKLLHTSLRLSESFINAGRSAGASTVLTSLAKLLLGVNPRTGKPDHVLNMTRFVFYGYWLPEARLAAVSIIKFVAASPAHQAALLATLTATPATASAVLRTFSEALDAEEEPEAEVPDTVPGAEDAVMTRLVILDMLQCGLTMPAPSLSHFLLGFNLKKGVSATQLESPHIAGIRTPLHAILSLLSPAEHGTPTTTLASCPHLVTASYRLLFTLISSPVTSEPVLRYLRSSSYLAAQLATLGPLLTAPPGSCGPAVAQLRAASWLLRCVAVEVRVVAASRQHSQLATLLGLLLDRCEADTEAAATSLYQDTTFSQLSRTVTATTTRQLTDSPASSHRLALVLGCIEFESGSVVSPGWDLFDESQVAGVLEQCQVANMNGGRGEPLVYRILAVELSTIQGSAAVNQRAMIQSEIRVQENAAARRDLLDSWRQVAETLLTLAPAELLPAASKQQILLQLLQTLLNKVAGESLVSGMDSLVSSTVLLLMTALRQTYTAAPDKQDIMGDTFVGLLDT